MTTAIALPGPRTPVIEVDPKTGVMTFSRPWFLFLQLLWTKTGGAVTDPAADVDAIAQDSDELSAIDVAHVTERVSDADARSLDANLNEAPSRQDVADALNLAMTAFDAQDLTFSFSGFANPTAEVELSAVNGQANTAMRSDAAPPIDQTIAPTWMGAHTWTVTGSAKGITVNNAGTSFGLVLNNTSTGYGANVTNSGSGLGLNVTNSGTGSGVYVTTVTGTGLYAGSTGAGAALWARNTGAGLALSVTAGGSVLQGVTATTGAFSGLLAANAGQTATNVSITGSGSLAQIASTKFVWAASQFAIDLGAGGGIFADGTGAVSLGNNLYYGASGWTNKTAAAASLLQMTGGGFNWFTAPSAAAGAAATLSTVMAISNTGALSLPLVATNTTAPAAGGAGALPATPAGYMAVTIAGTARRIPYYT